MDATTMPSIPLLKTIQDDYPQFSFVEGSVFRWSPESKTIYVDSTSEQAPLFVLHELGHALLNHQSYTQDINLLKLERDAWEYAIEHLSATYDITIDENIVQDNLDTYRDWLHARSLCPACGMTGLQSAYGNYSCLACGCKWKSNEARNCALRRHITSN